MTMLAFILFAVLFIQEPTPVTCKVVEGRTTTTLICREGKKTFRRYIPRTAYRFIKCDTVNLQREPDGRLVFASDQSCHIIDTQEQVKACRDWQASQKSQAGYELARNPELLYLPDCEYWWTHVEGDQALVTVYQMRPLQK